MYAQIKQHYHNPARIVTELDDHGQEGKSCLTAFKFLYTVTWPPIGRSANRALEINVDKSLHNPRSQYALLRTHHGPL